MKTKVSLSHHCFCFEKLKSLSKYLEHLQYCTSELSYSATITNLSTAWPSLIIHRSHAVIHNSNLDTDKTVQCKLNAVFNSKSLTYFGCRKLEAIVFFNYQYCRMDHVENVQVNTTPSSISDNDHFSNKVKSREWTKWCKGRSTWIIYHC